MLILVYFQYYFIIESSIFFSLIVYFIYLLAFLVSINKDNNEKLSPYECGFNPFMDARLLINIRFYIVGILFLLFDLELLFIFPLIVSLHTITIMGLFHLILFLVILALGFVFEWKRHVLDWE